MLHAAHAGAAVPLVPRACRGAAAASAAGSAQTARERQPLITEALVDAENGTLTINGFDFAGETPAVTLGMTALPVPSMTESGVVTGLPEVLPGTYLLALSLADGAGAVFYPTLGAMEPAGGAQGPQGEPGPVLSAGSTASGRTTGVRRRHRGPRRPGELAGPRGTLEHALRRRSLGEPQDGQRQLGVRPAGPAQPDHRQRTTPRSAASACATWSAARTTSPSAPRPCCGRRRRPSTWPSATGR